MRLRFVAALVAALVVALMIFSALPARRAFACSASDDFDPVSDSDVIVSGVILGWQETLFPGFPENAHVKPILVEMQVEEVLKGDPETSLYFLDTGSLMNLPSGDEDSLWDGSGGACGAFNADPIGQYALLGLAYDEAGNLRSNLLRVFYIGERTEFAGPSYKRAAEMLASFGLTQLPATGHGSMAPSSRPDYELLALGALLIAFGLGGLKLLRRTA